MFVAGTETVTTTLRWSMIYMSIYPDIMSRVQKEIDDVIGPSRMVSFNDRAAMPYTRAVIHEIQRVADIVPLGVPHKALQDIHTRGYVIPAGTLIMPFHYGVHRDPKHWDKPYSFNPHRFLNERGDFRTDDEVIPYGLGRLHGRITMYKYNLHVVHMSLYNAIVCGADLSNFQTISFTFQVHVYVWVNHWQKWSFFCFSWHCCNALI